MSAGLAFLDVVDVFLQDDFPKDVYGKMMKKIHSKMEEYSGNEDALAELLEYKIKIYEKSPNLDDDILRQPRRYVLDKKNLPTLKMGDNMNFCLDFNLADIADDIAKLKYGERIALGRDTSQGDHIGVVKHLNVFYGNKEKGGNRFCRAVISCRQCDIYRNEAGQLELIDTSIAATRVLNSPVQKDLPASFVALEDEYLQKKIQSLPQEKTFVLDEKNLPKLKLDSVEFDLVDIADKIKGLESGKCIAIGRLPEAGEQINVADRVQVGEDVTTVSRRHCNIWRIDGKLILEDCSLNGTTIQPKKKELNMYDLFAAKGNKIR